MISELLRKFLETASRGWHRRGTLLLLIAVIAVGGFTLFRSVDVMHLGISRLEWLILAAVIIVAIWIWILTTRPRRAKHNTIGIVVAISGERQEDAKQLASDLIKNLRELLTVPETGIPLCVVVLQDYHSDKIFTPKIAAEYLEKCRGHLMIYGSSKLRPIAGVQQHVLALEGIVRHKEVGNRVHAELSAEFRELWPRRVLFEQDGAIFSFEITAEWLDLASRYIIGVAALISGDPRTALSSFKFCDQIIRTRRPRLRTAQAIRERLPRRLIEAHFALMKRSSLLWRKTRRLEYLRSSEQDADQILQIDKSYYSACLHKAICCFALRRDVQGAIAVLKRNRCESDSTWQFSLAFLYTYSGQLHKAFLQYQQAFRGQWQQHVPLQAIEFIEEVLRDEPHMWQLHYCLGQLFCFALSEYEEAGREYQILLDNAARQGDAVVAAEARRCLAVVADRRRRDERSE